MGKLSQSKPFRRRSKRSKSRPQTLVRSDDERRLRRPRKPRKERRRPRKPRKAKRRNPKRHERLRSDPLKRPSRKPEKLDEAEKPPRRLARKPRKLLKRLDDPESELPERPESKFLFNQLGEYLVPNLVVRSLIESTIPRQYKLVQI